MNEKAVVVTLVAALLGILAAALGFAAEVKRVKEDDLDFDPGTYECIYPKSLVGYFASAAVGLLLVAQLIILIFAGCVCCFSRGSSKGRIIACIAIIFAWIMSVLGILLLVRVALLYLLEIRRRSERFSQYCLVLKPGVAAGGGAAALISVLLGIVYYHVGERMKKEAEMQVQQIPSEIPLAQPQFPGQPPVIVRVEAYYGRQIA